MDAEPIAHHRIGDAIDVSQTDFLLERLRRILEHANDFVIDQNRRLGSSRPFKK